MAWTKINCLKFVVYEKQGDILHDSQDLSMWKAKAHFYATIYIVTMEHFSVLVFTPLWLFLYLLLTRDEFLFTHYMLGAYCCTWSHSVPLTQTVGLLWSRYRPVAEISTCQQTTLKRETTMSRSGLETAIPASERPQTPVLDRAATEFRPHWPVIKQSKPSRWYIWPTRCYKFKYFIVVNALHVSGHNCPSSGARNYMCSHTVCELWGASSVVYIAVMQ
jgi:hypothetical protein